MSFFKENTLAFLHLAVRALHYLTDKTRHFYYNYGGRCLDKSSPSKQQLDALTESVESFLAVPQTYLDKISSENDIYKPCVEIYLLLKQVTSLYEAESKVLPLQVFNEMRNSIDHFMRSLITSGQPSESHIGKMEGHLQRGYLDVCKLLCYHYDNKTKSVHKFVTRAAVGMANDGEYVKEFTIKQQLAYKKFSDAKFEDYRLGDDHSEKSVRILYLEAVLLHKELCSYQCEKMSALTFMLCKSMAFRSFFTGTNFIVGVGSGIVASILFTKLFGP